MNRAIIKDIQFALPKYVESNEFLISDMNLSWSADDIYNKTGIKQRHIAGINECASDFGCIASEKMFTDVPNLRECVDFVIFCSQSADYALPSTASLLQHRLNLSKTCGSLDINQGCSGYIYGLSVAKGLIEAGVANNILLITAETYSKYLDKFDRSTRSIFGDGAAATLIGCSDGYSGGMHSFVFGTDGRGAKNLIVPNSASRKDDRLGNYLFMDGPEIFQFTLNVVPKTVEAILEKANLQLDDVDYFVFHQANAFILEHLRKKLHIPMNKFFLDMSDTGNTVSASIPIALRKGTETGYIKKGMKVMLLGFGVGYSWGGCILEF